MLYSWVYTLNSIFFTSSNDDEVFVYNGGAIQRFSTLGYLPTGLTAMGATIILPFADRIVLVRTIENTGAGLVDKKVRVRWHVRGDVSNWNDDGSGLLDVVETSSQPIMGAGVLGDRAFIFKERQIIELIQTGSVELVFRTETRVHGTGMTCRHSWATADQFGFFVGPDDVYAWDGSTLQPIGGPIRDTLFQGIDFLGGSDVPTQSKVQGMVYTPRQEYWLFIQAQATGLPNLFIYDYRRDRWYTDNFAPASPSSQAIGILKQGESIILNPGDINQTSSLILGRNAAVPLLFSEDLITRDDSAFTSRVVTREYPAMKYVGGEVQPALDRMNTLWEVMFRAKANQNYSLSYSIDGGLTFSTAEVVQANAYGEVRWFVGPLVFNRIRFKIESSSTNTYELSQQIAFRWSESGVNYGANP